MDDPTRTLRRSRRHAIRALKGHAGVFAALVFVLWVARRVTSIPTWLTVGLIVLGLAPLVIDFANICLAGRDQERK